MKVIRTNSTRLELIFAELHTMLPIPKGGEISEIEVDNRGQVMAVWLKDTEVVRDLAEKAVTPVVEPAPVGGEIIMDVKVTEHEIEPTPPPKTYDVEFKGLTLDEFVILRCALTDGRTYKGKLRYKHVHDLKVALDTASPGAYNLMMDNIDRILES